MLETVIKDDKTVSKIHYIDQHYTASKLSHVRQSHFYEN